MGLTKFLLALYLIGLTLPQSFLAEIDHQDYFMHELNQARVEVGVAPLTWNNTLVAYA
jgi:hypothetical protein